MVEWDLRETYHTDDGVVRWASFGDGEPVVFLHGTPFSSFIWRDIASFLASTRKVYVWDMLGFGQSDKHDRQDVSLAHQGRIFADLLKIWNLDEPSVVAHDVGGAVALRATLIEGVSFRHLTLVDAVSIRGWGSSGFFQTISEHPEVFMQLPDWATEGLIESKIRTASHPGLRPYALERYLSHWRGVEGRGAFYRQYAQAKEAHTEVFQERLAAMSIPVRIIWGQEDQWLPIEYAQRLHGLMSRAEFAVIGGAGHAVQEDSPGQLLSYLMA